MSLAKLKTEDARLESKAAATKATPKRRCQSGIGYAAKSGNRNRKNQAAKPYQPRV